MLKASAGILSALALVSAAAAQAPPPSLAPTSPGSPSTHPLTFSIYERARQDTWQWFAAPPTANTYPYLQSLLRIALTQRIGRWDWQLELSQPAVLGLPDDAVSPVSAPGQLGLGATYYASSANNTDPAAAFLKQGFLRYRFAEDKTLRVGRFEFLSGVETHPKESHRRVAAEQSRPAAPHRQLRIHQRAAQLRRHRRPFRIRRLGYNRHGRARRPGRLQHERQS